MRKHSKLIRFAVLLLALVQIAAFFPRGGIIPVKAAPDTVQGQTSGSVDRNAAYLARAREFFKSRLKKLSDTDADPNEVIRVIVETDDAPVAELTDSAEYTDADRKAEERALEAQAPIIAAVEKLTGNKVLNSTAYLVNGFSIMMKRSQMSEVSKLDGVSAVYPASEFKPDMMTAVEMTSSYEMWAEENGGYTGEGIVIAVIDSGVNYDHPDMKLDDGAKVKFTEEQMKEKIEALGYGKYFSEKVPFGYTYGGSIDGDVYNDQNTHGLHVSGIAAANGGDEGITGVAPNAQIFAMQVFAGGSGSASTDDIIKAVEDSVKLGADVINLSLGSGAGFYGDENFLQRALENAETQGVVCCVAAGNAGVSSSLLGETTNDWGVIDTGDVSAPSTYPGAISVAAIDNYYMPASLIDIYVNGELFADGYPAYCLTDYEGFDGDFSFIYDLPLIDCGFGLDGAYDMDESGSYVVCEDGEPDLEEYDFENVPGEDTPWVALIERGYLTFEEKLINAYMYGAVAAIVYNNAATDEVPSNISAGAAAELYTIMVSGNLGAALAELAGEGATVTLDGYYTGLVVNPNAGQMTSFSSWGPTPTLDIKPELSAPGGNIYSVSAGDGYEFMSGTSMASPYVAGASALVMQALNEAIANGELVLPEGLLTNVFAKASMMNTADAVMNGSVIAPVRQQGAGLVDPLEAANNRVLATYEGLASAALREIGTAETFVVTLTNYGKDDVTYTLPKSAPVYTDYTDPDTAAYGDVLLEGAAFTFDTEKVTVPAGGSVEVKVALTLSRDTEKDHFIEGFITFDGDIDISLPVLAYYGSWEDAGRIVDEPWYEEDSLLTNFYFDYYYNNYGTGIFDPPIATGLITEDTYLGLYDLSMMDVFMLFSPDNMAISPNGDDAFDVVQPTVGMLRSAETVTVDVLDEDGNVLRRVNTIRNVEKTLGYDYAVSGSLLNPLSPYTGTTGKWDGTLYDQTTGEYVLAPEGQYYIRVGASTVGSDKVEYTTMPVKVDLTAPEITVYGSEYDEENDYLTVQFKGEDTSGIVQMAIIFVNDLEEGFQIDLSYVDDGGYMDDYYFGGPVYTKYDEKTDSYTVSFPVFGSYIPGETNEVAVVLADHALNEGIAYSYADVQYSEPVEFMNLDVESDVIIPTELTGYTVPNPDGTVSYYDLKVFVRGSVDVDVAALTINGEDVEILSDGSFAAYVPVEIGTNDFTVTAYNSDGEVVYELEKILMVDLSVPEVSAYVAAPDKSGAWGDDMTLCSYMEWGMDNYAVFATMYESGDTVPVAVNAADDALESVTVRWLKDDIDDTTISDLNLPLYVGNFAGEGESFDLSEILPEEEIEALFSHMDSVTLSAKDLDENGMYFLNVPMTVLTHEDYDYYEDTYYTFSYEEQYILISAVDEGGNESDYVLKIEGGVCALEDYDYHGDVDIRDGEDEPSLDANLDFLTLDPSEYFESVGDYSYALVTSDMVEKLEGDDNRYVVHFTGTLSDWISSFTYNAETTEIPEDLTDTEWTVEFDVIVEPGSNIVYYYLEYLGELIPCRMTLYFIPDDQVLSLTFDDERIDDDVVIYTNEDTFDVSGEIFSLVGYLDLNINGDQIMLLTDGGVDTEGGRITGYKYLVPLNEGENVITVELYDDSGYGLVVTFTVVRDTKAPDAPQITVNEKHTVSLEAVEEDVVIYYSLDGVTWTPYTEAFTLDATATVYAKAVDLAGNESVIASVKVIVPPEAPVITADEKGTVTVTTEEEGVTLYYSLDGETWTECTEPFTLEKSGKVYAKAVDKDGVESDVVSADVVVPPKAPVITADEKGTVTVTTEEEGVTLYYSLDGETWTEYTEPVALEESGKVYAKAVSKDGVESDVASADVVVPPEAPVITADEKGTVTVTTEEESVTLYYSLDGETWTEYTEPFTLKENGTVYAKAVDADGVESEVVSADVKVPGVIVSENKDVEVEYPAGNDEYYEDIILVVDDIEKEDDSYTVVVETVGEKYEEYVALDIYLWNETTDSAVSAEGELTVRIAVPEGWDPAKTAVMYVADDGTMTNMNAVASADGKTISFKTTHFSVYVLVNTATELPATPPETNPPEPDVPPQTGDDSGIAYVIMCAISVAGLAILAIEKKRSMSAR